MDILYGVRKVLEGTGDAVLAVAVDLEMDNKRAGGGKLVAFLLILSDTDAIFI